MVFVPVGKPVIDDSDVEAVTSVLKSGWASAHTAVAEFERSLAVKCNRRHCQSFCNGTASLYATVVALGLKTEMGDSVLVSDQTFIASASIVAQLGGKVIPVDVDPETWVITPETVLAAIKKNAKHPPKIIISVDLLGNTPDHITLQKLCDDQHIILINDAAQSLGAEFMGEPAPSFGYAANVSYHGNKIITAGEGGAIVTNSDALDYNLSCLKDHGQDPKRSWYQRYYSIRLGFNGRMNEMSGALGASQLKRLDEHVRLKRAIFNEYTIELGDVVEFQAPTPGCNPSRWMTAILLPKDKHPAKLADELMTAGFETRPFFAPLSKQPALASHRRAAPPCYVSHNLYERGIMLPCGVSTSKNDIAGVSNIVREFLL